MASTIQPISQEDIIVWADDTWCFRSELEEMTHMSDDYRVIPVASLEWDSWTQEQV